MLLEIIPLEGVGPVKFGMTSQEVQNAMKNFCGDKYVYSQSSGIDYFFGSAMEVSYDDNGFVQFIGTQPYTDCGCDFQLYNINPFDIDAKLLFKNIASKQPGKHKFDPDNYIFRHSIITLYEADEQYDYNGDETRPVYAQVGIGNDIYLSAIDKI